jgi:hypothetical protein
MWRVEITENASETREDSRSKITTVTHEYSHKGKNTQQVLVDLSQRLSSAQELLGSLANVEFKTTRPELYKFASSTWDKIEIARRELETIARRVR